MIEPRFKMKLSFRQILSVGLFSLLTSATPCSGAGIFLYEIASTDTGLASAGWSSRAETPSTLFTNPAGMIRLQGQQLEFGAEAVYVHVEYDKNSSTTIRGEDGDGSDWLPSGSFFYTHSYKDKLVFGVGALGYFGSRLKFNDDWVGRYSLTETTLMAFSLIPALAVRLTPSLSIGAGLNLMYGIFDQKSALSNTLDLGRDGSLQLKDEEWGAGAVAGILWEISSRSRIGIQYLSQVYLPFHSKPHFHDIGPLLKAALQRTGIYNSLVNVSIRVPQSVIVSGYHRFTDQFAWMLDLGWQEWSQFEQISFEFVDAESESLVVKNHFKNCWHAATGVQFNPNQKSRLSLGVGYDTSPISNHHRPLNFPAGKQIRIGAGGGYQFTKKFTMSLNYELSWSGDLPSSVKTESGLGEISGTFTNTYAQFINLNFRFIL